MNLTGSEQLRSVSVADYLAGEATCGRSDVADRAGWGDGLNAHGERWDVSPLIAIHVDSGRRLRSTAHFRIVSNTNSRLLFPSCDLRYKPSIRIDHFSGGSLRNFERSSVSVFPSSLTSAGASAVMLPSVVSTSWIFTKSISVESSSALVTPFFSSITSSTAFAMNSTATPVANSPIDFFSSRDDK